MKKRVFLALPLPEKIRKILSEYKKNYPETGQIRWTSEENLHITLHFFGYEKEESIPDISKKIKSRLKNYEPFNLTFEKITLAPPTGSLRMIWALFEESQQFAAITNAIMELKVSARLQKYKPVPHVTLARFKYFKEIKSIKLTQPNIKSLRINQLVFFESKLTREGPIYKKREELTLKNLSGTIRK